MAAHVHDPQYRAARYRLARDQAIPARACRIRPPLEGGAARESRDGNGSIAPRAAHAGGDDVACRCASPSPTRQRAVRRDTRAGTRHRCSAWIRHHHGGAVAVSGARGGAALECCRARILALLRRAPPDPGRPARRPPARTRQSPRSDARRAAAHQRLSSPRAADHGADDLESRRPRPFGDLRARARALRARRRAATQHAGARAGAPRATRFAVAGGRQPHRTCLLLPAAQPARAQRARDDG
jgi:hypothetical protein